MTLTDISRRSRRSVAALALGALVVLTLAGAGSTGAPAASSQLPDGAIAPTEKQHKLARQVGTMLEEAHYSRIRIDNAMSPEIFNRYLDSLDGQRSYFLASDIAEFAEFKDRFDDMIHTGAIEPTFQIYARFQQRYRERIEYALSLLATEPDFTVDESFQFDRTKAPWPATAQELNELWRKRVKTDALSLLLTGKSWADTATTLKKRYERNLQTAGQVTADEVFERVMNAYARSYDPHSSFFSPRNSEEYKIQMSLSYEGIGATLQQDDEYASIVNLIPGGPAAIAGTLGIKDRITAIAQDKDGPFEDVIGWRLDDVVQLIRGKGGTTVRLQILPAGAAPGSPEKVIELVRGRVTLENQAAKKERRIVTRNGNELNIGVINVPSFYRDTDEESRGKDDYRSTTRDVARLIGELKQEGPLDGLVLDLRGDGGGFLPEAQALVGLFIDKGPVVQLKNSGGRVEVLDDPIPGVIYGGPLVVLIDRYSASASEIFAAAIQDYGRGYVVGQRSFGKGTVQQLFMLDRWTQGPGDGQLTVTIGKFYRVTGESTQHRGVEPDIQLPSPIDMDEVGESSLDAALPWDRIAPASFQKYKEPRPIPTALQLGHQESERGKNDPDLKWLKSSIAVVEQLRKEKTLSLNLAKRQTERTAQDAERLRLDNERRKALGKPVFATLEEMEKANGESDSPDGQTQVEEGQQQQSADGAKAQDPNKDKGADEILLDSTTQIMADIITGIEPAGASPTIAQRENQADAVRSEAR
jgi:carboxyl-terminal processing protease